jgi:hypothetical protein
MFSPSCGHLAMTACGNDGSLVSGCGTLMRTALPFWRTTLDGPAQIGLPVMSFVRRMISRRQGLACMGGILAALEQALMQHLVQQGVVIGDEVAALVW